MNTMRDAQGGWFSGLYWEREFAVNLVDAN